MIIINRCRNVVIMSNGNICSNNNKFDDICVCNKLQYSNGEKRYSLTHQHQHKAVS